MSDHWKDDLDKWITREEPDFRERPEDEGPPEYWQGKTGKWFIIPDWPLNGVWSFHHDDYDGAPIETGGPPADHRSGHGSSWADCVSQIEEMEAAQ